MKKIISILGVLAFLYGVLPVSLVSCTDVSGNGVDSIYYGGSNLPQNSSYRNPIWEPSLEGGTIIDVGSFVAISSQTQWAKGLTYDCPIISSENLMEWNFNQREAFAANTVTDDDDEEAEVTEVVMPDWAEGRIHSMAAGVARTVVVTPYWLFYQIGDAQAIGAAYARTPMGPYEDTGKLLDSSDLGTKELKQPYFVVFANSFYLLYSTEDGSYMQRLTLRRESKPELNGSPVKIADKGFEDVALYRTSTTDYYLFGTVKDGDATEIRYARATSAEGPYLDKEGESLLNGSKGTLVVESSSPVINPENVCGIFDWTVKTTSTVDGEEVENEQVYTYLLYNATNMEKPLMDSGFARKPLFMSPLPKDKEGWYTTVIRPEIGWTSPRYGS